MVLILFHARAREWVGTHKRALPGGVVVKEAQQKSADKLRCKQVEQTVAKEQSNLRALFDVVNVAMLLIDENAAVQQVNDAVSRWTGRELAPYGDLQPGDLLGCIHALADPAGCGKTDHRCNVPDSQHV